MASLEYRLLKAGEEEAALNFFYSNFVAKEGQLCSVGAGRNEEVTRDMQAMLTSGTLFPTVGTVVPPDNFLQGQHWLQLMMMVNWLVNW